MNRFTRSQPVRPTGLSGKIDRRSHCSAAPTPKKTPPAIRRTMEDTLSIVRRHQAQGTLLDSQQQVAAQVLTDLSEAGYWGLRVAEQYGGGGSPLEDFFPFLTRMASVHSAIAGLAAVHAVLGPVNSIQAFGSTEQKAAWLPTLARGHRLGALRPDGAVSGLGSGGPSNVCRCAGRCIT